MGARGQYRGVYSVLPDDPDFQRLTPHARLVLYTARLCRDAGPSALFLYSRETLMRQTGLSRQALNEALSMLRREGWIDLDDSVLWVRNGLRYDPHFSLADRKHRLAVEEHVKGMPRSEIVLKFCDYYQITRPFEAPSMPHRSREEGRGNVSRERERSKGLLLPQSPRPSADEQAAPDDAVTAGDHPESAQTTALRPPDEPLAAGGKHDDTTQRSGLRRATADALRECETWERAEWGTAEALLWLYNTATPDNVPAAETLSPGRRERAKRMLRAFADRDWWLEVFAEYKRSNFLSGRTPPGPGHESFTPDLDWLLSKGRDGTENAVKVHDGKYRSDRWRQRG